jgi:hypothetical protein
MSAPAWSHRWLSRSTLGTRHTPPSGETYATEAAPLLKTVGTARSPGLPKEARRKNVEALIIVEEIRASRQTPVTGVSQADKSIKDTK